MTVMASSDAMQPMAGPLVTRSTIVRDLRAAGIESGSILCVHSALSSLGFVVGGARTVVEALIDLVDADGTVMMPTYSGELSDPAEWRFPPVPAEWIPTIRRETPPYDPILTPARQMGAVSEFFRRYPGARRSPHPQSSFSAFGKHAPELVDSHPLNHRFGPDSPLGALLRLRGAVLMLGASPMTNSLLYLSAFGTGPRRRVGKSAPLLINGHVKWVEYDDIEYTSHWFDEVTIHLLETGVARRLKVGAADCLYFPAEQTIAETKRWRLEHNV